MTFFFSRLTKDAYPPIQKG